MSFASACRFSLSIFQEVVSAALIVAGKEATKFEGLRSRKSPRRKACASALTLSLLPLYRVASKACTM